MDQMFIRITIASMASVLGVVPCAAEDCKSATNRLLTPEYHISDLSFCNAQVCADINGDGQRELLFASRAEKTIKMLRAADGTVLWSRTLPGDQQSLSVYDLDHDGVLEILYSVSSPGILYVLNHAGKVLRQWNSGDHKLGNAAVIIDVDHDGQLDGLLGSRSKALFRLNMNNLTPIAKRQNWRQCGGHTTAMDVDRDGRWDLFAGSGDDGAGHKGVMHRYDPVTLKSQWAFQTNDNASSADPVLVDIDNDGDVEILKSVDNYAEDEAHDALYAFETDGTVLWKVDGISEEDSPNAADLDGDGHVEIVGMTFGCEVYCLDSKGRFKWRKDLRPELDDYHAHAYLTPVLCDLNGEPGLEILAMTNGCYFDESCVAATGKTKGHGILFALSAGGEILDSFNVGGDRYWGDGFVCNVDDDPLLELVVSGSGGLDVIQLNGFGPDVDHVQRRRTYQRLNVFPWAYEDSYFVGRGAKENVRNRTDNLVLTSSNGQYAADGAFVTPLLHLAPGCTFDRLSYTSRTPSATRLSAHVLNRNSEVIRNNVTSETVLNLAEPVQLKFRFHSSDPSATPTLDAYSLTFLLNK